MKPLEGYLIVDFSQFLSGPSASLRLADLGARVIKIEKPETGDICRELYTSNVVMNKESSVFHAINRNKESLQADLKNPEDLAIIRKLVKKADVAIHNFRPGVMARLGLDYKSIKKINPEIIYAEISGYGDKGPWKDMPGQDLLLQARTGLTWLSGNKEDGPVPMGLAVIDILAGAHLTQGILACLVKKTIKKGSALIQVSMLESAIDFQFETLTTYQQDGGKLPERTATNNAHAYLGAPYGIYKTKDGYLALAMGIIPQLGELLNCPELKDYPKQRMAFDQRDEIKHILAHHLKKHTTSYWLAILEPADIWCADVLTWDRLMKHDGFKVLDMVQKVEMSDGFGYKTTRCPIKIDGETFKNAKGSPKLGEHSQAIINEFNLK